MSAARPTTTVLLCEDPPTYARALARFLGHQPDIEVVAVCRCAKDALESLRQHAPDLVIIDLELPEMGGVETVEEMMRSTPVAIVAFTGDGGDSEARASAALAAGVVATLSKDHVRVDEPDGPAATALALRLRRLARRPCGAATVRSPERNAPSVALGANTAGPPTVIGIGASTGGPAALEAIFGGLPGDYPIPVLVVQHMATGFTGGLVDWLDQRAALPIALATHGMVLTPGIWFAPDDAHLLLEPTLHLALDRDSVVGAHRPAVDMLLSSLAAAAGASAVGVVLTGMGRDGAKGASALQQAGAQVIAQDEQTSVIFGMPSAAIDASNARVIALPQIAGALRKLALRAVSP